MLRVENASVVYPDGTRAVSGVSFSVADGENVALLGANGAGKSTLLLALVGVLELSDGGIWVDETRLNKKTLGALRERIGLVFQNPDDQLFMPRISDDVAFGPRNFGCSEEETRERVDETLTLLGIARLAERSPLKLSGGEKRLAALATVLAMRPSIMLFDEPTAFLDPKARRSLTRMLSDLPQAKLIATHDLAFIAETCGRVLLMQEGRLIADGGIELLEDSTTLEAAGL